MNVTGWSRGLDVTADGAGIVSHAGLALLRGLADNTGGEPLAWMLRRGAAGSNTATDHIAVTNAAIAALPPACRRLMVTVDGAGASHELIEHRDTLASQPGHQLIYSVGWAMTEWEKTALRLVPEQAWV